MMDSAISCAVCCDALRGILINQSGRLRYEFLEVLSKPCRPSRSVRGNYKSPKLRSAGLVAELALIGKSVGSSGMLPVRYNSFSQKPVKEAKDRILVHISPCSNNGELLRLHPAHFSATVAAEGLEDTFIAVDYSDVSGNTRQGNSTGIQGTTVFCNEAF